MASNESWDSQGCQWRLAVLIQRAHLGPRNSDLQVGGGGCGSISAQESELQGDVTGKHIPRKAVNGRGREEPRSQEVGGGQWLGKKVSGG